MVNEICDCCTALYDCDSQGITKGAKNFCSVQCMKSYAIDHELARIAIALEGILERLEQNALIGRK